MHNPMITFSVPSLLRGTSDRKAGKVSEVQDFRGVPPTETRKKCRRSAGKRRDLRQFCGVSVGGPLMLLPARCLPTQKQGAKGRRKCGLDLHPDVVRAEALECCAVQFFAVVRMGDADELLGAFLEGFAVEVHCSVLCHDIVHVRS